MHLEIIWIGVLVWTDSSFIRKSSLSGRVSSNLMIKSTYGDEVASDDDNCYQVTREVSIAINAIGNIV